MFGGSAVLMLVASSAAAELTLDDIVGELMDTATRVQRDRFWEENEGQQAVITGRVTDVRPEGWVLPMTVEMSTSRPDVSVSCLVLKSSEDAAAELGIGDEATCRGNFFNYTLLFDALNISLDNATVE